MIGFEHIILADLFRQPEYLAEVNRGLTALENETASFSYPLDGQYRFRLRHQRNGDYFHFSRYLAAGQADNVVLVLMRNPQREIIGCCQIILQERTGADGLAAYFCDLKILKAYRRNTIARLARYLLRHTLFGGLLDYYWQKNRLLSPDYRADVVCYFVNMSPVRDNKLVQKAQRWFGLFRWVLLLTKGVWLRSRLQVEERQLHMLHLHPLDEAAWTQVSGLLADYVPSQKDILLYPADGGAEQPWCLYHCRGSRNRQAAADGNIRGKTSLMARGSPPEVSPQLAEYVADTGVVTVTVFHLSRAKTADDLLLDSSMI